VTLAIKCVIIAIQTTSMHIEAILSSSSKFISCNYLPSSPTTSKIPVPTQATKQMNPYTEINDPIKLIPAATILVAPITAIPTKEKTVKGKGTDPASKLSSFSSSELS